MQKEKKENKILFFYNSSRKIKQPWGEIIHKRWLFTIILPDLVSPRVDLIRGNWAAHLLRLYHHHVYIIIIITTTFLRLIFTWIFIPFKKHPPPFLHSDVSNSVLRSYYAYTSLINGFHYLYQKKTGVNIKRVVPRVCAHRRKKYFRTNSPLFLDSHHFYTSFVNHAPHSSRSSPTNNKNKAV